MEFLNKYHENPKLNRVEFEEVADSGQYSHLVRIVPTDGEAIEKPIFTEEMGNLTALEQYVDQLITDAGLNDDTEPADE